MATPSSSATTPSPSISYLVPPSAGSDHVSDDLAERDARQSAIQRFMARAELSKLTRALRVRLSYASYKATHNLSQVPLRALEVELASKSPPTSAKRKAATSNNYYNNPATQGNSAMQGSDVAGKRPASALGTTNATHSLYSSIIALPPPKRARTIHNPGSVPLAPPARVTRTPKNAVSRAKRDKGKDKQRSTPSSTLRRAGSQSSFGEADSNDVDMKAAATLTELLLSRPVSGGSPRSSFSASSDQGSAQSYPLSLSQQFAQSSARTGASVTGFGLGPTPMSSVASVSSVTSSASIDHIPRRSTTPTQIARPTATAAASDSEAADLMLLLANSPSPARPTVRDRDFAMTHNVFPAGRVLFTSARDSGSFSSATAVDSVEEPEKARGGAGNSSGFVLPSIKPGMGLAASALRSPPLTASRSADASTVSGGTMPLKVPEPLVTPPSPASEGPHYYHAPKPTKLLPPLPSPSLSTADRSAPPQEKPAALFPQIHRHIPIPPATPAFDMNEYINVSPSPARAAPRGVSVLASAGLRPGGDGVVGGRLFDDGTGGGAGARNRMRFGDVDGGALGSGIDLVKT